MGYKIKNITVKEDSGEVGIVLEKPGKLEDEAEDGFAIWLPREKFEAMTETDLEAMIKEEVKKRKAKLEQAKLKKQEAGQKKQEAMAKVEALKDKIFTVS